MYVLSFFSRLDLTEMTAAIRWQWTLLMMTMAMTMVAVHSFMPSSLPGNPKADPAAIVPFANARFTVLTSSIIRMEYIPHGNEGSGFVDDPTAVIWNRRLSVPPFEVRRHTVQGVAHRIH